MLINTFFFVVFLETLDRVGVGASDGTCCSPCGLSTLFSVLLLPVLSQWKVPIRPFLSFLILFFLMFFTLVFSFVFASSLTNLFHRFSWFNNRLCFFPNSNFAWFYSVGKKKVWFLRRSRSRLTVQTKTLCSTPKQIIDIKKKAFWALFVAMTQTPADAPQSQTKVTLQTPVTTSGNRCYLLNVYFPTVSIWRLCSQRSKLLSWNGGDFY